MEGRKLNFNAPFLSVRRGSSATGSSYGKNNGKKIETSIPNKQRSPVSSYKSDWNLDQVTKPVAVPFLWEQTPGIPKDDTGLELQAHEESSSITPRLPPCRISDRIKENYPPDENFKEHDASRLQIVVCSSNDNVRESEMEEEEEEEDYPDAYSDALDTLYSTNSSSMSCSASGFSEDDYVKPSGTFSTDPQTRDFMMSRFLPAAKAMALDSPNYASKKQLVVVEKQPIENKSIVTECRRIPVNQYEYSIVPYNEPDVVEEETETEDEDDDGNYVNNANVSKNGCGLLPRFGCLLNPVPGLKVSKQFSLSSTRGYGKTRTESHGRTVKKHVSDGFHNQKPVGGFKSTRLSTDESNRIHGYNRPNRPITNSTDQKPTSRSSSPSRRSGCISPYRNAPSQSPFRRVGFLGTPREGERNDPNRPNKEFRKDITKSHELLFPRSTRQNSRSTSPAVEKTLYVDTVKLRDISGSGRSGGSGDDGLDPDLDEQCKLLGRIKVTTSDKSLNTNSNITLLKSDDVGKVSCSGTQMTLLPPPLPKTPSESWLSRAMPTTTNARNSFLKSYFNSRFVVPKNQDQHSPSHISKWETIVKTSYMHHDHVRYSEELLTNVTHQSKP